MSGLVAQRLFNLLPPRMPTATKLELAGNYMAALWLHLPAHTFCLASAKERGLDVAVILDKSNDRSGNKSRYSGATFVARAGIPVFIDYQPAIAHNKIIIDHHLVIRGSYNFTRSAERRNAENVTFIDSAEVASRFLSNWNAQRAASRAYADYGQ